MNLKRPNDENLDEAISVLNYNPYELENLTKAEKHYIYRRVSFRITNEEGLELICANRFCFIEQEVSKYKIPRILNLIHKAKYIKHQGLFNFDYTKVHDKTYVIEMAKKLNKDLMFKFLTLFRVRDIIEKDDYSGDLYKWREETKLNSTIPKPPKITQGKILGYLLENNLLSFEKKGQREKEKQEELKIYIIDEFKIPEGYIKKSLKDYEGLLSLIEGKEPPLKSENRIIRNLSVDEERMIKRIITLKDNR